MDICDVMLKLQHPIKVLLNTRYIRCNRGLHHTVQHIKERGSSYTAKDIHVVMKELDSNLVAYFISGNSMKPSQEAISNDSNEDLTKVEISKNVVSKGYNQKQLDIFDSVTTIKLQMEALTLQTEGTQRMDLLQTDIRPIFTIECQLSHELIKSIQRSEMYHIMQFESEKFQSLTQCTRFGMEDQRAVKIGSNNSESDAVNLGRIHFSVWWRESGTCLNEILGMGVLELEELYNASLLEQCKCVAIVRRGIHLANIYFKISLLQGITNSNNSAMEQMNDIALGPYVGTGFNTHPNGDKNFKKESSTNDSEANQVARNTLMDVYRTGEYLNDVYGQINVLFLVHSQFWESEITHSLNNFAAAFFQYQELFSVIKDGKFFKWAQKQFLQFKRVINVDRNEICELIDHLQILNNFCLPPQQYYIPYRGLLIHNNLFLKKLTELYPSDEVNSLDADSNGILRCTLDVVTKEYNMKLHIFTYPKPAIHEVANEKIHTSKVIPESNNSFSLS